jgi:hypothetical protein
LHPDLHSRYAHERLEDDHGVRPDDPTDATMVEVDDAAALLPRAVTPDED